MNDYEKRLEEAKRARMLDMKPRTDGVVPPRAPQKNRIEEILGERISNSQSPIPNEGSIPALQKSAARAPDPSLKIEKLKNENPPSSYFRFLRRFFAGLLILLLAAAVGTGGSIALKRYQHPPAPSAQDVVAKVGKLVDLPQGETPTVATVSDLKPLEGQAFFKDAAVGDKVLIYATSSKAILYRPSTDKVITVAPLNR